MPVAATPGLDPHDEVAEAPLEPLEVEVVAAAAVVLLAAAAGALLVLLLLLPQPAITMTPDRSQGETKSETHPGPPPFERGARDTPVTTVSLWGARYWCQDLIRDC